MLWKAFLFCIWNRNTNPMKQSNSTSAKNNPHSLLTAVFMMLLLGFPAAMAVAQDASAQTIKGVVRFSEDNEPAPGVNIYLKGSPAKGTYSDAKGQFTFPHALKTRDVLVFSFIGRESAEYVISGENATVIEIVMAPDPIQMVEDVLVEDDDQSADARPGKTFRRVRSNR